MKKLYYSIGEVSDLTGAEAHMLRYWETKITQLRPKKNKRGKRLYTEEDISLITRLKALIVDQGYSVEGAQRAINQPEGGSDSAAELTVELKRDLAEIKQFLEQLNDQL